MSRLKLDKMSTRWLWCQCNKVSKVNNVKLTIPDCRQRWSRKIKIISKLQVLCWNTNQIKCKHHHLFHYNCYHLSSPNLLSFEGGKPIVRRKSSEQLIQEPIQIIQKEILLNWIEVLKNQVVIRNNHNHQYQYWHPNLSVFEGGKPITRRKRLQLDTD